MADKDRKGPPRIPVKIPEDILRGVYANQMMISHTREEFMMDWINLFPPEGIVNARIIISPGHLKRVIRALEENIRKYEENHGEIGEAPEPSMSPGPGPGVMN